MAAFLRQDGVEVDDVGGRAQVDNEELGELITAQLTLGKDPAVENNEHQEGLFQCPQPLAFVELHPRGVARQLDDKGTIIKTT